ncbi:MAG: hypothetical protein KBT45_01955 [Bacteroidales bacterium]|nr:hypothetical protein [Candidatus Colimorpha pelethequi]
MTNKIKDLMASKQDGYKWNYCSVGGVMRVNISTGEDIRHLGELDQKLWTVLSCPTKGLEFCEKTLQMIDADKDGKIRVQEIVATANWLCDVLADPEILIHGGDGLKFTDFADTDNGKRLCNIARQIVESLGHDKDGISIEDTSDSLAIFSKTRFNGDGIITLASTEDEALKDVITKAMEKIGAKDDRSGEKGIDQEILENFYKACADYAAWCHSANDGNLPYGADTEAALEACNAIKAKVADYFMRCKLIAFDEDTAAALDVQVAKVEAISGNELSVGNEEIASYPLARPNKDCLMPINGQINPSWRGAFDALKSLVLDKEFAGRESFSEAEWNTILAKFDAYTEWKAAKAGAEVEEYGIEVIDQILADNRQADLQSLIEQDLATADDIAGIDEVDKLLYLKRDFYKLLRNYVSFTDFYSRREGSEAIFQCGTLYIDQRSLDLCVRVEDMVKQTEMAGLSGMYLIYCQCTNKVKNQTMNIVAVLTDGDVDNMRVGKNAIFYDRTGQDWDAVVTKIVDNPISIRQAFFSPYRKLANFITDKVNKSAAEKEAKSMQNLTAKTDSAMTSAQNPDGTKPAEGVKSFDIAKFAGIFAAIGMGLGMIGAAVMKIINPWYNVLLLLGVLVICTSGPSVFIAWTKLRKRNLGPILNANGWAINSKVIVNIIFGQTLTSLAKYPKLDLKESNDPFVYKTPWWKKALRWVVTFLVIIGAAWAIMVALHLGPYAKHYNINLTSSETECSVRGGGENLKDFKYYDIKPVYSSVEYEFLGWSDMTNKSADGQRDSVVAERRIYLTQDTNITAYFKKKPVETPEVPAEAPAETPAE